MAIMDLDKFEEFVKTDYIPKATGRESPIRAKIIEFLRKFEVEEIRMLKCVSMFEARQFQSRINYYSRELLPKVFGSYSREEDKEFWLYVKRKGDVDNATKKLHN